MMKTLRARHRLVHLGRNLARDEAGAALIYVSVALTVFMGFAALVIDGSRLFTLDTELQGAADALALAGAAELDGRADAETRANAAIANLVQNQQTFATGASAITGYSVRYLSVLPDDDQPLSTATVSPNQTDSRFAEVTITQREIDSMFATAIGGDETAGASAVAVAGFTSAVCKFTPLFMCNPFETTNPSRGYFLSQFDTTAERRRIIAMKKSGSGAAYTPGNFGFLESQLGPGAKTLAESLASVDPGVCFRQDGVETKTGSTNSAHRAVNVRFDIYDPGVPGSWQNSADYRPAKNVTKGYLSSGNGNGGSNGGGGNGGGGNGGGGNGGGGNGGGNNAACNSSLDTSSPLKAMGFPIDSAIDSGTRLGNGVWDLQAYWTINHPGVNFPPAGKTWSYTGADVPSRYDVYRWEIDSGNIPNNTATGGENGAAACNTHGVSTDTLDRRIIYAAVINCTAEGLRGGSGDTVPALAFMKMFITQPMTKLPGTGHTDEDDTLYVEMVDIVQPGSSAAVVHDIVQLYR